MKKLKALGKIWFRIMVALSVCYITIVIANKFGINPDYALAAVFISLFILWLIALGIYILSE